MNPKRLKNAGIDSCWFRKKARERKRLTDKQKERERESEREYMKRTKKIRDGKNL